MLVGRVAARMILWRMGVLLLLADLAVVCDAADVTVRARRSQLVSSLGPRILARGGKTMKAVFMERHGGPEVLKYGDLPDPVPKPGEVVVDIHAGQRQRRRLEGAHRRSIRRRDFPYVLGRDFSGIVSAVGEGVTDFRVGDPVFAVCEVGQEGAYAEKIAIKAAIVAKKPAEPLPCRCRRAGARRAHRAGRRRGHAEAEARRDDPDPGRRRRRRGLRHPARQAHRRARDHHRERRQPRLRARASAPTR